MELVSGSLVSKNIDNNYLLPGGGGGHSDWGARIPTADRAASDCLRLRRSASHNPGWAADPTQYDWALSDLPSLPIIGVSDIPVGSGPVPSGPLPASPGQSQAQRPDAPSAPSDIAVRSPDSSFFLSYPWALVTHSASLLPHTVRICSSPLPCCMQTALVLVPTCPLLPML